MLYVCNILETSRSNIEGDIKHFTIKMVVGVVGGGVGDTANIKRHFCFTIYPGIALCQLVVLGTKLAVCQQSSAASSYMHLQERCKLLYSVKGQY